MFDLRRAKPALWIAGSLAIVAVPAPAVAATTVGQTFVPTGPTSCFGSPEFEVMQTARASGPSGVIAADGVLASWSFQAGATPTVMTLRVFRPTETPNLYRAIADGSELKTIAAFSGLQTFPARIPVEAGDVVGIRSASGPCGSPSGNSADTFAYNFGIATSIGASGEFATDEGFIYDISASLEPDADADGFGDETQDFCPTDASKQAECDPPETTITKGAPNKTEKSKVKFKFTSDEPDSTFECKLKGKGLDQLVKQFGDCASPRKYKRLEEGKFKFSVRAIDAAGNVDPSPAKDAFKVLD